MNFCKCEFLRNIEFLQMSRNFCKFFNFCKREFLQISEFLQILISANFLISANLWISANANFCKFLGISANFLISANQWISANPYFCKFMNFCKSEFLQISANQLLQISANLCKFLNGLFLGYSLNASKSESMPQKRLSSVLKNICCYSCFNFLETSCSVVSLTQVDF